MFYFSLFSSLHHHHHHHNHTLQLQITPTSSLPTPSPAEFPFQSNFENHSNQRNFNDYNHVRGEVVIAVKLLLLTGLE